MGRYKSYPRITKSIYRKQQEDRDAFPTWAI